MECMLALFMTFVLGAGFYFFSRLRRLERGVRAEIEVLKASLQELQAAAEVTEPTGPPPSATPAQPVKPVQPVAPAPVREVPAAPPVSKEPSPMPKSVPALVGISAPATSTPVPSQRKQPEVEQPDKAGGAAWELVDSVQESPIMRWFMGSHIVVRAGIIILFIGVAFLLKYAADQGWLSIQLRLTGAGLLGLGLVYGGWHLRERRRVYALTLQGGGLGIAYMTIFVAFRLYDLLPAPLSFAVLVGLGLLCAALAVLNDAKALAVLAITGGFAAPILISTGEGSHITLFTYFALLNIAILAIAWFKAWRELNLLGYLFTFVLATLWGLEFYQPAYFTTVEPYLILFFLFYVGIGLLFAQRQPPQLVGLVDGPLVFGTPLITFAWQIRLVSDFEYGLAWSALAMGLFYLALAVVLFLRASANYAALRESYLALGIVFVTLAVPLAFDPHITASLWALEGVGLVWIGLRQRRLFSVLFGGLAQAGAAFFLLVHWVTVELDSIWDAGFAGPASSAINAFFIGGILIALSGLITAYLFLADSRRQAPLLQSVTPILHLGATLWGLFWWYAIGIYEIARFVPSQYAYFNVLVLFLVVTGALGEWIGGHFNWRVLRATALLLWAPVALLAGIQAFPQEHLLANWGWLAWPGAVLVHYWALYRSDEVRWLRIGHAIGLWLLAWLVTLELLVWGAGLQTEATIWTAMLVIAASLALVLAVTVLGRKVPWPTGKYYHFYMTVGLSPLVALLVGWSLLVNLANAGDSAPLPYMPLLNPLSLTQALILAALFLWLNRLKALGVHSETILTGRLVGIALVFLWINAGLARMAHQLWDIPFQFQELLYAPLLQAVYSILWTLLAMALMFAGTRLVQRSMWLTGAGLLALTVLKLLVIDLSGANTLARIASFIVVGLLMLLIGYVAPIPPAATPSLEHTETKPEPADG